MVQGLAAQSGGKLLLHSRVGHGTAVQLFLPVAEPAREAKPGKAAPAETDPGPPRTILVVDDDRLVLANTAAMLEDLGHQVTVAPSGHEVLAQLERGLDPDLLLTDQLMPGMTGTQLIRAAAKVRPQLKCLLMSGYAELTAEDADDRPVLAKPFSQAQLAAAVRDATASARVIQLRRRQ
jgi:CheY-like chemotaxis protein